MNYWIVKSEPGAYSYQDLVKDGSTPWDGVRNYQARNNLKEMKKGDQVMVYHSVNQKEVVGIAKVAKEYFQDPTTDDDRWVAVQLEPVRALEKPVSLATIKADKALQDIKLVRQSRLSVIPIEKKDFDRILKHAKP